MRLGNLSLLGWETTAGESHRCAKLTNDNVREILRANDIRRDQEFADRYHVSRVTVQKIRTRQRWRHITANCTDTPQSIA